MLSLSVATVYRLTKNCNQGNYHLYCHWLIQHCEPPMERPLLPLRPIRSAHCFPTFPLTSCTLALPWTAGGSREQRKGRSCSSYRLWRRVSLFHMHGTKLREFTDQCSNVDPCRQRNKSFPKVWLFPLFH